MADQPPPPPPAAAVAASVFAAPPQQQTPATHVAAPPSAAAALQPPQPTIAAMPAAAAAAAAAPLSVAVPTSTPMPNPSGPAGTLEADADLLLTGDSSSSPFSPSAAASASTSGPILHPPPLPRNESGLDRCRTLAGRRAWVDVLAVAGELLTGPSSPHSRWYGILGGDYDDTDNGDGGGGGGDDAKTEREQAETCEILRLRLTAYLRLRRHVDLAREVERLNLLDEEEEEHGDSGRSGGSDPAAPAAADADPAGAAAVATTVEKRGLPVWVDLTLTILAATSLLYTDPGNPQRCLDVLQRLRWQMTHPRSAAATGGAGAGAGVGAAETKCKVRYLNRINIAIANVHLRRKEWRLALSALDDVLRNLEGAVELEIDRRLAQLPGGGGTFSDKERSQAVEWLHIALLGAARIEIRSRQGWIFLQSGAISEAARIFALADRDRPPVETALRDAEAHVVTNPDDVLANGLIRTALIRQSAARCFTNEGLHLLALQDYEGSMQFFTDAMRHLQRDHTQDMSAAPSFHDDEEMSPTLGFGSEGSGGPGPSLIAPCLNNLALCALYTCQMNHAVSMMESLVREGPTMFLTERLAFNLCTLYELGGDGPTSERKKRVLQLVSKRFFLHDIGSESFRIN